eukprot:s797_g10.t1
MRGENQQVNDSWCGPDGPVRGHAPAKHWALQRWGRPSLERWPRCPLLAGRSHPATWVLPRRRRTAWTDYKLGSKEAETENQTLSRQSTADTDFGAGSPSRPHEIKMSPSTRNLLVTLEAQKCIGCCIQRTKVLEDALTYCRIPGYCENCPCTDDGWSPLLIATQRRDAESVETLLSNGAEVDCKEPQSGWTPLMFAASLGDCHIVKLLLKYNASVNAFASPHDWNPLCAAIQANNKEVVRVLLDAGADISLIKKRHPALAEVYESELNRLQWDSQGLELQAKWPSRNAPFSPLQHRLWPRVNMLSIGVFEGFHERDDITAFASAKYNNCIAFSHGFFWFLKLLLSRILKSFCYRSAPVRL